MKLNYIQKRISHEYTFSLIVGQRGRKKNHIKIFIKFHTNIVTNWFVESKDVGVTFELRINYNFLTIIGW